MLRKIVMSIVMGLCLTGLFVSNAMAGEVDMLVQKLVEKGILSPNEAQILMDETKQDVAKQNAQGTNEMIPSWVQTVNLKGDVRLRYQTQQTEGSTVRNRGRVRGRLGLEAKPAEKFQVGLGIATGGDTDSRSTNETFGDVNGKDQLWLDYAWALYQPMQQFAFIGGKYNALAKNFLWYTTDMLWDSDINQEGASVHAEMSRVLMGDVFANAGYWTLSESGSDAADAGMYYAQAGIKYDVDAGLENPLNLAIAGTFYGKQYNDTNTLLTDGTSGGTQTAANGLYDYNNVYAGSAELVYKWPEETSFPIKMVGAFGDYVNNPDADSENTGWATGVKFGHAKVSEKKAWQLKYQYVRLEKFAWIDVLPDSDRYNGRTNAKGHEFMLDIGLAKNVSLGLDYYRTDLITGTSRPETLFQADVVFKF